MKKILITAGIFMAISVSVITFMAIPLFSYSSNVSDVNDYRQSLGSHALIPNKKLDQVAEQILDNFINKRRMDVDSVGDLVGYRYKRINKIIVANVSDMKGALRKIKGSRPHRTVLLGKRFVEMGNAYSQSKRIVVIVFGSPER